MLRGLMLVVSESQVKVKQSYEITLAKSSNKPLGLQPVQSVFCSLVLCEPGLLKGCVAKAAEKL